MFSKRFQELSQALQDCSYTERSEVISEQRALEISLQKLSQVKMRRGIVYTIGNGGSAGIASHFSNDLMKALEVPSQTLYDSNLLTCISNDLGYENIFSYPLSKLLNKHDLVFAISSSGQSQNILNAAKVALERNIPLVTFSGFLPENPLRKVGNLNFWIDRSDYGLVETAHFFLLHTIVDLFSKQNLTLQAPSKTIPPKRYAHARQD